MSTPLNKTILIYPHMEYTDHNGGVIVQYYLASVLKSQNVNVKIFYRFENDIHNPIFSDFTDTFDNENTIVIYCEGIYGNPLNAKYVVRWMLSELGKNMPHYILNTWGKSDLIYYFVSEPKIKYSPDKINSIYKFLTMIYVKPNTFKKLNKPRNGVVHTFKKSSYHKNGITHIHPDNSQFIETFLDYNYMVEIFNTYKYFVCYDPCSFLVFIAALCGCVPILHKVDNVSKEEYFTGKRDSNSCLYPYYMDHEYTNYPGIAYGLEDVPHAESTLHLLPNLLFKQIEYINTKSINNFINDMKQFDNNINTIQNNLI
jgi:hypothetical protein